MKIEIDTVKGFQDFLPPESLKRNKVKEVIEKFYKLYGFLPIETPVIEFDELMRPETLTENEEDEAVSDRFKLKDRAGRNLGLRYEFTFQLSRIFKQNPNIKLPFRRYQIGPVFRDEPVSQNRFRQFVQCDADIIGDSSIDSDIELISLVSDILKELKISSEIIVNNRKLLNSIVESVQIQNISAILKELDKKDKINEDDLKANLRKYADPNQIITLFKLLEKPLSFFEENAFDGASELQDLISKCKNLGLKINFSPFMVRGLAYYTGNIFEIKEPGKNSIAAGGRYDKLVGKYLEREIPAVGISFGLERMSELAQVKFDNTKTIVISIDEYPTAEKLVKSLRKSGVSCILSKDKPGKALEYANSYSIPYAIFIGEKEIEIKKFNLRNMQSGEEKLLTEKQLIKMLS